MLESIDSDDSAFSQDPQSRLWPWLWTADVASEEGGGR